ncbi:hypothetical protein [Cytobacillus gottheilii]|uniref:hypothetical protein n=1 Tax=Cytobacillus gottheilii TaxID=859144 RepID=UPI003CFAB884
MTVMLLVISLFLNILAFVAIINLYMRQTRLIESEKNQAKATEEMEEIISTYLTQMKEENDEFLQKLSDLHTPDKAPAKTSPEKTENKRAEPQKDLEDPPAFQAKIGKASMYQAAKVYQQNKAASENSKADIKDEAASENSKAAINEETANQNVEPDAEKDIHSEAEEINDTTQTQQPTLLSQALVLKNLGLTNDEIAKKLNKGKTEIQLLLKFHEKQ